MAEQGRRWRASRPPGAWSLTGYTAPGRVGPGPTGSLRIVRVDDSAEVRSLARTKLRLTCLREWGAAHLGEQAALVVTELATNAVLHAGSPYEVRLTHAGTPEPQPLSAVDESGRGIVIVAAVSASWGIETQPHGKVTWAELRPG